jgi:hypothetical protein
MPMDAHRRHCADSAAEAASDDFAGWSEEVDRELAAHHIGPTAFTQHERFAAWTDGIDSKDCVDAFAHNYYAGYASYPAPGDCDDPVDHSYAANYETCEVCGGRKPYQRSCDCHDNHCQ